MEVIENCSESLTSRLNKCEVCAKNKAKYTCPRCELRTCCLECVKIHKMELECNGVRDKVKFKMLKNFNNIDLLNDYRLLEETARVVNKSVKLPAKSCYHPINGTLPTDLYRLKCTALSRGIQLHFLPPNFTRRCSNTSYLDHKTQNLYWRIDWIFPQADKISMTDDQVLDSSLLSSCVQKYVDPEEMTNPSLSFYQAAGQTGIKLLLKAERTAPNKYYLLDPTRSLRENLRGKSVIEYPVIYVILNDHIYMFDIFDEGEEENLRKRQRRRLNLNNNTRTNHTNNFLFPVSGDDVQPNGEFSDTDDDSNVDEMKDSYKRHKNNHRFPYHQRGWRRNNRRTWNRKNNGKNRKPNSERVPGEKTNYFAASDISGGLSNNFNSINIQ